ncbi:Mediator of RNA polymerase II transcription subunit 31 [Geranomyces variabilis]|uniref:Mediator of RNA polymerase II transcription subunit 31 n=1 Tax=Geranomyces variabilis TaxID=109894 RepID=A0AAD5XMQ9_9FUNG|nr:Mediator of RNA polymerase II transcription subunit 31 [Geranomyces variabilis]
MASTPLSVSFANPAPPSIPQAHDEPDLARKRFQLELEFVQCLANPQYLQFLAQQQYFSDPAFLNYLAYLRYWQQPQYAIYITYPYALHILDLLQHPAFRHACSAADTTRFIHEKEYWHWRTYRKNRIPEPHQALDFAAALKQRTDAGEALAI